MPTPKPDVPPIDVPGDPGPDLPPPIPKPGEPPEPAPGEPIPRSLETEGLVGPRFLIPGPGAP